MKSISNQKSVKPHILSWLQRAPNHDMAPVALAPLMTSRDVKAVQSRLIPRACLGSTTANFLLLDQGHARNTLRLSLFALPIRVAAAFAVVCFINPAKTTSSSILDGRPAADLARPTSKPSVQANRVDVGAAAVRN